MVRRRARERDSAAKRAPLLGVVLRDQFERFAIEQRGVALRPAPLGELSCTHELLDRALVVAGADPVTGHGADRVARYSGRVAEELGDECVSLRAVGTRQEVVGDVADQNVRERELLLALDDRRGLAPDEIGRASCRERV